MGGAGPTGKGVYVVSSNCKLYLFDDQGNMKWWFRLAGVPGPQLPQLVNGTLYVVANAPTANLTRVCPFDNSQLALDRYGCPAPLESVCYPCFEIGGGIAYLYAFQVE